MRVVAAWKTAARKQWLVIDSNAVLLLGLLWYSARLSLAASRPAGSTSMAGAANAGAGEEGRRRCDASSRWRERTSDCLIWVWTSGVTDVACCFLL